MRQCIALASLVCLLASGCAQSGFLAGRSSGVPAHVAIRQNAPRPTLTRGGGPAGGGVPMPAIQQCSCDASCGCGDGCCDDSCCDDGQCGRCSRCRGGVFASGCGVGGACMGCVHGIAGGFCPHGGGYPEQTSFNPGPPVGQVAYPYYTVRGPRDFLAKNPPSIGPY